MLRINEFAQKLLDKVRKYFENTNAIYASLDKDAAFSDYAYYRDLLFNTDPYVPRDEYLEVCKISRDFLEELEKRHGEFDCLTKYDFGQAHKLIATLQNATFEDRRKLEQIHKELLAEEYYSYCDFYMVYEGAYADYQERILPRRILHKLNQFLGWWAFV
jgi:hypothetical protein